MYSYLPFIEFQENVVVVNKKKKSEYVLINYEYGDIVNNDTQMYYSNTIVY